VVADPSYVLAAEIWALRSEARAAAHPSYVQAIAERVQAHGILLIFDEVLTGFGRTGTMWKPWMKRGKMNAYDKVDSPFSRKRPLTSSRICC
jgi:hypothetical protein